MRIFAVGEANHYCSHFRRSGGDARDSIDDFCTKHLVTAPRTIAEGTPIFEQYRDCSLRDVERSLFFAVSHHRRSLDLMMASAAPWAYVTLYYGSWYASRALLGMFGCALVCGPKFVVHVSQGVPGQQQLELRRIGSKPGQEPTQGNGPHQKFWDLFYTAVQSLVPVVDPRFGAVLSPVSGDRMWQIDRRNEVNYDTYQGCRLAEGFHSSFTRQGFPGCLPGIFSTQFGILETLLELDCSYARQFHIGTDALDGIGGHAPLREKVRHLIYAGKAPGLVHKSRKVMVA